MEVAPAALLGSPMDGEAEGQVTAWTGAPHHGGRPGRKLWQIYRPWKEGGKL
jgi:hypothetical protein